MKTQLIITVDGGDMANVSHLLQAWNLVGGAKDGARADAKKKRAHELDQDGQEAKLFGKIGANQFTMEDIHRAVAIIKRRHKELYATASDPVFTDPKIQETWGNGLKANADHAVRLAETFLENLKEDLLAV